MNSKFSRFIERVRNTQPDEISCSECLDKVSDYVDYELSSGDAAARLPKVQQHLGQCQVCAEEHQLLLELARLEAQDQAPAPDELARRLKHG